MGDGGGSHPIEEVLDRPKVRGWGSRLPLGGEAIVCVCVTEKTLK